MPKESLTLNGFLGGLNLEAAESDIVSEGQGQDECVNAKNLSLERKGKIRKSTVLPFSGGTADGENTTTATKALIWDNKFYQNEAVYKVGSDINWNGKNDFIATKPTTGDLNPTHLLARKDGVDLKVVADRGKDILIFLGKNASINPYNEARIGDSSTHTGIANFIKYQNDYGGTGDVGDSGGTVCGSWNASGGTSSTNREHMRTYPNAAIGAGTGATLKSSTGAYDLVDWTDASTANMDISDLAEIGLWHYDTQGSWADTRTTSFARFRVGDAELSSGNNPDGLYGVSMPNMDGMDIVIELKANTGFDSSFDGLYIFFDCQRGNMHVDYDTTNGDSNCKTYKITESAIDAAGENGEWVRIVVPHESAIHTGGSFDPTLVKTIGVGMNNSAAVGYQTGGTLMDIREISLVPSSDIYNWSGIDFQFSQTRVNISNEEEKVESIPTVYSGTFSGSNNAASITVQRPEVTHGITDGKIYYQELDSSGSVDGDKFLMATYNKTNGLKKVGQDTFTAWSKSTSAEMIQDGNDVDIGDTNWTGEDDAGNADGWEAGAPAAFSNNEKASLINTLAASTISGQDYKLTFTIGVAQLNIVIGGKDNNNTSGGPTTDFIAAADYGVGTHSVGFTAGAAHSHLWFEVDNAAAGTEGQGTIDNVSLHPVSTASITFDNPPVASTYTLESGYHDDTTKVNALFKASAVVGRQVYIGNVAEELNHETIDTFVSGLDLQADSGTDNMRRLDGTSWTDAGFTSNTGFVLIEGATNKVNDGIHDAEAIGNGAATNDDWEVATAFGADATESAKQIKVTQFGEYDGSKILKGAIGKVAGFSDMDYIDLEFGGDVINALESSGDRLFIFSDQACTIINVAQDVEFMEAQLWGQGTDSYNKIAKVGEGLAWVNGNGVYFFDGEKVNKLTEAKLDSVIFSAPAISYIPHDNELVVWSDANAAYVFSFKTQTWTSYLPLLGTKPVTNSPIGVLSGSTLPFYYSGALKYLTRTLTGNDVELKTGKISMGSLARNKKFHKIIVRGIELDNFRLLYSTNNATDVTVGTMSNTAGTSVGEDEFKLSGVSGKWIQLTLEDNGSALTSGAEIEDISIIYRWKNLK